ncbi:MAG: hypothetical protein J2P41_21005 [Blastocatellia bacterium]|nr:hypothetical protein [Blastocatellia bacterium]
MFRKTGNKVIYNNAGTTGANHNEAAVSFTHEGTTILLPGRAGVNKDAAGETSETAHESAARKSAGAGRIREDSNRLRRSQWRDTW